MNKAGLIFARMVAGAKSAAAAGLVCAAATFAMPMISGSAASAQEVYAYTVEHPSYGKIGTYTDTITHTADGLRIDTKLRVAVRVFGIVVHREEADRSEVWQGDRLVGFNSVTRINRDVIKVTGEAQGDGFLIHSPSGTVLAPGNVRPSSPWAAAHFADSTTIMSTKTGKVEHPRLLDSDAGTQPVDGAPVAVRHYAILTDKRQDVWLNRDGIPLHFRTEVAGTPIDFNLAPETIAALGPNLH